MIVALACETSGLIPNGADPGGPQFPWPVAIGAVLFDFDGHDRATFGSRIRAPEDRSVSTGAAEIHGITTRESRKSGLPEVIALGVVCGYASEARYLVGFNVCFSRAVLESSLIRLGKETRKLIRPGLEAIDLAPPSSAFCKIPSERDTGEYRHPKLSEALAEIRNERPANGRDALIQARAAKRLFLSLRHRGALDVGAAA